jgi:hypothetical protein
MLMALKWSENSMNRLQASRQLPASLIWDVSSAAVAFAPPRPRPPTSPPRRTISTSSCRGSLRRWAWPAAAGRHAAPPWLLALSVLQLLSVPGAHCCLEGAPSSGCGNTCTYTQGKIGVWGLWRHAG